MVICKTVQQESCKQEFFIQDDLIYIYIAHSYYHRYSYHSIFISSVLNPLLYLRLSQKYFQNI